jgi:hypothetical protein
MFETLVVQNFNGQQSFCPTKQNEEHPASKEKVRN